MECKESMLCTHQEFEKEFPKLSHLRHISDPTRYISRVTREWFVWFCMYKMQEAEIVALKAEVSNLKEQADLQTNSIVRW
jgi:hypothetical protein